MKCRFLNKYVSIILIIILSLNNISFIYASSSYLDPFAIYESRNSFVFTGQSKNIMFFGKKSIGSLRIECNLEEKINGSEYDTYILNKNNPNIKFNN